jgi:plastocyanin
VRAKSAATLLIVFTTGCGKDAPTYGGPPIAVIAVSAPSNSVIIGQTLPFSAVVRDVNGDVVTGAQVQWLSSATNVATVAQNGVVTGRTQGIARISGRVGIVRDSLEITVTTNTFDVNTAGEDFLPTTLTIPVGATVRFNIVGEHNALFAAVQGAPPDIPVVTDTVVSRTFNTRGTFPYDCRIHSGMIGEIVVQ